MANVAPPKPAPKPGRVIVYRALYDYTAREAMLSAEYIDYPLHDAAKRGKEQFVTECLNNAKSDFLFSYVQESKVFKRRRMNANLGRDQNVIGSTVSAALQLWRGKHGWVKKREKSAVRLWKEVAKPFRGKSANSLDKSGSTALHWASYAGHASIVRILVAVPNMCISAQNKLGDTALHAAAWKGHAECVRILLESGANTSIRNNERKRPIDIAADAECRTLIHLAMSGISQLHSTDNEYLSESDTEPSDS
uniref:ANK_REP_REGION domain-containing protein n=1 Tax=Ascaris lumbricoides TaxID=6252 RepID=A0A0M3HUC5_ASCLU